MSVSSYPPKQFRSPWPTLRVYFGSMGNRWQSATSVSSSDAVLLLARVLRGPSSSIKKCCQQMVPEKIHRGVNVYFGKVQATVGWHAHSFRNYVGKTICFKAYSRLISLGANAWRLYQRVFNIFVKIEGVCTLQCQKICCCGIAQSVAEWHAR